MAELPPLTLSYFIEYSVWNVTNHQNLQIWGHITQLYSVFTQLWLTNEKNGLQLTTPPPNHILFLLASLWLPNKINNWTISPEIFIVLKDSTKDSICFLLLLSPLLHTPTARVQNFRRSDHSSETFLIVFVCFFFLNQSSCWFCFHWESAEKRRNQTVTNSYTTLGFESKEEKEKEEGE